MYIFMILIPSYNQKNLFLQSPVVGVNNEFNSAELSLDLYEGEILQMNQISQGNVERVKFEKITINFFNNIQEIDRASKGLREMSVFQIKEIIDAQVNANQSVNPIIYVEYHRKIFYPPCLSCFCDNIIAVGSVYSPTQSWSRDRGFHYLWCLLIIYL